LLHGPTAQRFLAQAPHGFDHAPLCFIGLRDLRVLILHNRQYCLHPPSQLRVGIEPLL
jgi:hypothetical protein